VALKTTKKIAVSGSHGVGKTTLVKAILYFLKKDGYIVDEVTEVAREARRKGFSLNELATYDTQMWIVHRQICRELEEIQDNPDFLVCDRSIMDNCAYTHYLKLQKIITKEQLKSIIRIMKWWIPTYDTIFLVSPIPRTRIEDDGVRSTDKKFQWRIHNILQRYVKNFNKNLNKDCKLVKFVHTDGSHEKRMQIIEKELEKLGEFRRISKRKRSKNDETSKKTISSISRRI